jgi:hypothetical protein
VRGKAAAENAVILRRREAPSRRMAARVAVFRDAAKRPLLTGERSAFVPGMTAANDFAAK